MPFVLIIVLTLMLSGPHVLCGLVLHVGVSEYLLEILRAMLFQGVCLDLCLRCCLVFLANTD